MSVRNQAYPAEYQRHKIELVRGGRTPARLAREHECSYETIRKWVKCAEQEDSRAAGAPNCQ